MERLMAEDVQRNEARFEIFRSATGTPYEESEIMAHEPMSRAASDGAVRVLSAGMAEGHDVRVLFRTPGFSLLRLWYKSGYPLPRHTHDSDCLYYVLGGSLRLGTEELGAGDGFFIGAGVPYAYTPGPAGVEVLEFRACETFNIRVMADNPAFWERAAARVAAEREGWRTQERPTEA
jgi:quercetin dioxygenase-like cupin family protein